MEILLLLLIATIVSLIVVWVIEYLVYKSERLISTLRKHWLPIAVVIIIAITSIPFIAFTQVLGIAFTDVLILFFGVLSIAIVLRLVLERIEYTAIKKMLQTDMDEIISEQGKSVALSNIFWINGEEDNSILGHSFDVFSSWQQVTILPAEVDLDEINQLDSPLFERITQDIHKFISEPY